MIYLEMSRDTTHGGGEWAFPHCVWSPSSTKAGNKSAYWSKILQVKPGDIVLHLRGSSPNANFIGYSEAASAGYEIAEKPPEVGEWWAFADTYNRADLKNYTAFASPVNLTRIFSDRKQQLEEYFDRNKAKSKKDKLNLFYVRQSGRLQCQNGAYLSDVDGDLLKVLFDRVMLPVKGDKKASAPANVATGAQMREMMSRIGQREFSDNIKDLYSCTCCFPGCEVKDRPFLIAAHIDRWGDNEALRGHMGNGLCLCLMHDKAYEDGYFTLDDEFRVVAHPERLSAGSTIMRDLLQANGQQIRLAETRPLPEVLVAHRARVEERHRKRGGVK
jgi:hypothetical protein